MSLSPQPSSRGSHLSRWLTSPRGQLLLHRSYSWGAALVILGALFKILELPYADQLLLVSMLTECPIFILSGFDSPKEEAGDILPRAPLEHLERALQRVAVADAAA